jgi:Uma2 family endonuclease
MQQTSAPPLQAGDRMTRDEFEQRLEAMPEDQPLPKVELLGGQVYIEGPILMLATVWAENHGRPHFLLASWLNAYETATPGVRTYLDTTVRLGPNEDEIRPDALLRIAPEAGGASRLSEDDRIEGAPELVCEVAASSANYDLQEKKEACRHAGVAEYLVWQIRERRLDWFVLEDGDYLRLNPDSGDGLLESRVFPGLHLDIQALLDDDLASVLTATHAGARSDAHAAFADRLEKHDDW